MSSKPWRKLSGPPAHQSSTCFSPDGHGPQSLRYRGQLDGSRPGNDQPLDGRDLRAALEAVLTGSLVNPDQTASVGCNVKWNPGHEPEWFG